MESWRGTWHFESEFMYLTLLTHTHTHTHTGIVRSYLGISVVEKGGLWVGRHTPFYTCLPHLSTPPVSHEVVLLNCFCYLLLLFKSFMFIIMFLLSLVWILFCYNCCLSDIFWFFFFFLYLYIFLIYFIYLFILSLVCY